MDYFKVSGSLVDFGNQGVLLFIVITYACVYRDRFKLQTGFKAI